MFGRKRKVVRSEPVIVRHSNDYPMMTVNIDDMDADDESFRNWIHSAGITSITVRSPFDPYDRKDMGLLTMQGGGISHESYNMMSAKINTELSNIMFRIIGTRYRTSVLVDNGYWATTGVIPKFRIDHDEYAYYRMVRGRVSSHINYWLCQCDDAPGSDALDDLNRMELGKALVWFLEAGPEKRKTYAGIITWVGPDIDPVTFLTGGGMNTAPARVIARADILVEHVEKISGTLVNVPDGIRMVIDKYVDTARSALTIIHSPATTPSVSRSWNDLLDIIEHSMMAVDALAMTAMTSNIARSNKQLDTALADTIHDIELMDNEYASKRSRLSA